MKKLKNGCLFVNIDRMEKFQITNPPKVWVSGFPSVDGNGISPSAIMKKLKNGCLFVNIDCMEKFQITDPTQSLGLRFSECQQKWNITISHYEKIEKWLPISLILIIWKNFKLLTPPKFGSLVFRVSTEMEYHCQQL